MKLPNEYVGPIEDNYVKLHYILSAINGLFSTVNIILNETTYNVVFLN